MRKLLTGLLLVGLAGCLGDGFAPAYPYDVKYELLTNCPQGAFLTYADVNEGTRQTNGSDGWNYEFGASSGQFLYVSAQNNCDTGSVTVNIYKYARGFGNGYELFRTATSSGAFVIATASGSY